MRIDSVRLVIIAALAPLFPMTSFAAQKEPAIDAINIVAVDSSVITLDADLTYDGSLGELNVSALAKSSDGLIRSAGVYSKKLSRGNKTRLRLFAFRPHGASDKKTDVVLVKLFASSEDYPAAVRAIPYPVEWPATTSPSRFPEPTLPENLRWNLGERDYRAIESLILGWSTLRERDADGRWKLEILFEACERYFRTLSSDQSSAYLKAWRNRIKDSVGAALIEAFEVAGQADKIRGPQWRRSRDPLALKMFKERIEKARALLLASKRYAGVVPVWYAAYLQILVSAEANESEIHAALDEAVERHPEYLPIYAAVTRYWAPPYGAKHHWSAVDETIQRAVQATHNFEGTSAYARLYADISDQQPTEFDLFRDSQAAWPLMKRSFEDLIARFPSPSNLNQYAAFACRVGDKSAFLSLYPRINGRIVADVWPSNYSHDLCRQRYLQAA